MFIWGYLEGAEKDEVADNPAEEDEVADNPAEEAEEDEVADNPVEEAEEGRLSHTGRFKDCSRI